MASGQWITVLLVFAGLCVQGLFAAPPLVADNQCDSGFKYEVGTGKCVKKWEAVPFCEDGFAWECQNERFEDGLHRCYCLGKKAVPRTKQCPANSQKVVLEKADRETNRPERFECSIDVEDAPLVVCNHGMVLDLHSNRCMAARAVDALVSCPVGYTAHMSNKKCVLNETETSLSRRLAVNRRLQNSQKPQTVDFQISCPKGTITAQEYHARTADSTVGGPKTESDDRSDVSGVLRGGWRASPGHGACYLVEFHELLTKCSVDGTRTTVDSHLDATPTNDCHNKVLVLPDLFCEKGFKEVCDERRSRGFGNLANDKRCKCEKTVRDELSWHCEEGGELEEIKNKDGHTVNAVCKVSRNPIN